MESQTKRKPYKTAIRASPHFWTINAETSERFDRGEVDDVDKENSDFGSDASGVDASATAAAPSVVHVDLMEPSTSPSIKRMMIKTGVQSLKAGPVAFDVSDDSKTLAHEMIVVAVANPGAPLPYDKKDDRVGESKIADLGEASDLEPGEKKTLRLTLKPGNDELICNQPGHYKAGMTASLVVTP